MRFLLLISSLIAICFPLCFAADWAVIIAGSNTFDNYRHQADTCHSYHIVRKFGIPDSQIITLMYNDIASDPSNPFPGKVFNKPAASLAAAVDVYKGCKIDYRGGDVNAANFLAVLTGNSTAVPTGKPVLKSTASDRVFVNFVDHGGSGILGMPNDEDYLYANDLITALKTMHTKKMYSKLVFYLEACESGSMFENILPANLNIYATTAANADESSWGDYCSPDDTIGGTEVGSCLGDLYSTNWMENSDAAGEAETLMTQMKIVTAETTQSHVSQYGTLSFRNLPIGDFQGNLNRPSRSSHRSLGGKSSTLVNTRDIPLHNKYSRYLRASSGSSPSELTEKALNELNAELASRKFVDSVFDQLARKLAASDDSSFFFAPPQKPVIVGTQCQKNVDHAIKQFCGSRNEYMMKYHRVVVNACHQTDDATIINHLKEVCTSLKPHAVQF